VNQDLERYLLEKGWAYKSVEGGRQIRIDEPCPFCGKKKHLMFSATTTMWDCKRCGETGNLLTMKRRLGDLKLEVKTSANLFYRGAPDRPSPLAGDRPPEGTDLKCHARLLEGASPEAMEYVLSRGFTLDTIKKFKLGVSGTSNRLLLSIPSYYHGELVCMKFRSIPPDKKSFIRWKDCPSVLFNGDCLLGLSQLPPRERRVVICESETDCMAVAQLGFPFVVASTTGAGKTDWPEHWLEPLEPATEILLAYDSDTAGGEGAAKAAAVLGKYRCKRVALPLHDCAKMVEAGFGKAEFEEAFAAAQPYDDSSVHDSAYFVEALMQSLSSSQPRGRSTGWVTLDSIVGGIRDGELNIITGDTGSGKSTWSTALARSQAMQNAPVLIAPFEQPCYEILGKLAAMEAGRSLFSMTGSERLAAIELALRHPIYWLERSGPTPFGDIKDAIYMSVHRFGVRFVLLDHLHFFMDCKEQDERRFIDQIVRALKVITTDLHIHIALVVHPAKLGRDKRGNTRRTVLDDLKGSSGIKQMVDVAFRVFRDRQDEVGSKSDVTEISVLKCRSSAGSEGTTRLYFDPDGERYLETTMGYADARSRAAGEADLEPRWDALNQPH